MTRTIPLILLLAGSAFAQIGLGVKGGAPLTDTFDVVRQPGQVFDLDTNRPGYVIGPYFELRLPFRFAIEFNALTSENEVTVIPTTGTPTEVKQRNWEFPVLGKYRFTSGVVRPFIAAGASFRKLGDIRRVGDFIVGDDVLADQSDIGFVVGGGVEFKLWVLRIAPEFRFTRWGTESLAEGITDILKTNKDQGQFLIGIGF
jgi:opacity protein-like surface antigen